MKVLWLCNIILPKIAEANGLSAPPTGGWLTGLSEDLAKADGFQLVVCFPHRGGAVLRGRTEAYAYCSFCPGADNSEAFERILKEHKPDAVHIFGTEMKHSLDMVQACRRCGLADRTVISIQGLISVIAQHYCAFLPRSVTKRYSLRDFLKHDNILQQQSAFARRGEHEIAALRGVRHVIGRTDWDRACVERINPAAQYHFCNETLRASFYEGQWSPERCQKHSIFVSQCSYPIKGFHLMLEAMADVVKEYPEAMLYTTGKDPRGGSLQDKLRQTYYSKYLAKLIRKYGLEKHVQFLGQLDESQMCDRFLRSNVFVSCSSIENSPNSLGEAMLLGVPAVSSDVGGVKNMLCHGEEGFVYQADAPYMLAFYIRQLFKDPQLQMRFSENARKHARVTHDPQSNTRQLLDVYNEVKNR